MPVAKRTQVDESSLERLLGLENSKIGFYSEVKQKIQELETANLGLRVKTGELQAVFNAISDGVVIYDNNGLVQHRNRVAPALFPNQTVIGLGCMALFHPDKDHEPDTCPVERALSGQSTQVSFSFSMAGGQSCYFDITATPIQDPNENNRALVFIRDVTEKKLNELQLLQAEKMSSIGMLAAGVAHEINNPLTSVAGYSEALLRRLRDDSSLGEDSRLKDFKTYLGVIIRESYRCKGIIDNLLSFSRKSEGAVGFVNLNQVLSEVLELVRHKARNEKIEIRESLQPDLPLVRHKARNEKIEIRESLQADLPLVMGDASGLRQVFLNLTVNAMQAIEGSGVIDINTSEVEGGMITATVSDTGCGITPAMLEQIWDPFFTTKEVGKGVGLGLAVSYNIIKKHGGEVSAESTPGKGSKFTVRLPLCQ